MKTLLFFILSARLCAQIPIYNENFETATVPYLPNEWFSFYPEIYTDAPIGNPSSGYPGASGGQCLVALNCNPDDEYRFFQVDNISTAGAAGLLLSFGHRRTSTFTPPVGLEYSTNGYSWQALPYNSNTAGSAWTLATIALPLPTQNQPSLSLKWSYITNVENTTCYSFAGNYRIDDVQISALTLPVELTRFSVSTTNNHYPELQWSTSGEWNFSFFAIQRSADSKNWKEIDFVQASGPSDYQFIDYTPLENWSYYRLKLVDNDESFSYSPIGAWRRPAEKWRIWPQPAYNFCKVQQASPNPESIHWYLFDTVGRLLKSGSTAEEQPSFSIDIQDLPAGQYFLRIDEAQQPQWLGMVVGRSLGN